MPKGYWIIHVDIHDMEPFKAYMSAAPEALKKFGARYLARGGRFENTEGSGRSRHTVIEFPSYQAALDCWNSPEYQSLILLRKPVSTLDLTILEGLEG